MAIRLLENLAHAWETKELGAVNQVIALPRNFAFIPSFHNEGWVRFGRRSSLSQLLLKAVLPGSGLQAGITCIAARRQPAAACLTPVASSGRSRLARRCATGFARVSSHSAVENLEIATC